MTANDAAAGHTGATGAAGGTGATRAVVVGASAGGVQALRELLPRLPADFPAAVLVVLHVPPDRPSLLADIFRLLCRLPVREAEDKAPIEAGTIMFAPPDYHLMVEEGPAVALSVDPPVSWSRPAIDVLFETAAAAYGPALTAIVLTGASHDGAAGLAAVARAGGRAVVQDPAEAEMTVMPRAALDAVPEAEVRDLAGIAALLAAIATR